MDTDVEMIRRVLAEVKARGGDPAQVALQLSSNVTLLQRKNELEEGVSFQTRRKLQIIDEINIAAGLRNAIQAERDHLIDDVHDLQKRRLSITEQLAKDMQERKKIEKYLTPAYWVLGVLGRDKHLLRQHQQHIANMLSNDPTEQPYSEIIEQTIVDLVIVELKKHGALVPRIRLSTAEYIADSLKQRNKESILPFLKNPKKLNQDQRRALLSGFIEAGLTKDNFQEFKNQTEISWRKCPQHSTDLKFGPLAAFPGALGWRCTEANCNYTE